VVRETDPFRPYCAVQLVLRRDSEVLLSRRLNTGFEDGSYGLVAGHIEGAESARQAMVREAEEEVGITIDPRNLRLALTMHRFGADREYIDLFFVADDWTGEPAIMEPRKCDRIGWFTPDGLPDNTIAYIRRALECLGSGTSFCEFGWHDQDPENAP
jgi:8-oxo-dGTP diphosphatase